MTQTLTIRIHPCLGRLGRIQIACVDYPKLNDYSRDKRLYDDLIRPTEI